MAFEGSVMNTRNVTHEDSVKSASFWPGLIDLVTSALMVFLLVTFIQTVLNINEIEMVVTRARQSQFMQHFEKDFRVDLAAGLISIKRDINFLQITFSDQVLFDSGQHRLKGRGEVMLWRCARLFSQAIDTGYQQIQVEGHTDSIPVGTGTYPSDNWELSTARAISVVRFLVRSDLLSPEIFSANGYADQRPIDTNATAEGRAKNRRIEIRLFFSSARDQTGNGLRRE
jgi:flagellar motor protein MotB